MQKYSVKFKAVILPCLFLVTFLLANSSFAAEANSGDVASVKSLLYGGDTLTADFKARDRLPESTKHGRRQGGTQLYGPPSRTYPVVETPAGYDPILWKRSRVIAVALKYLGLPYRHHHTPGWYSERIKNGKREERGLDCSNFTAWVYNYGLGIKFTGGVRQQADGPKAPGRRVGKDEKLEMGDLLFIHATNYPHRISHVVIYIDRDHIIDESGPVAVRAFEGWRKDHFDHARRIIE